MPNAPRQFRMTPPAPRHQHEKQWKSRQVSYRKWYATKQWKQLRPIIARRDNYLCQQCQREGLDTAITDGEGKAHIDHIEPHRGNWDKFIDPDNLQLLCAACHSRKTAKEDGGFGHN